MFQYAQAILEAVLALPRDEYSIVLAYRDPLWLDLSGGRARAIRLHNSLWSRILNRFWHEAKLSVLAWRKTAAHFDSNIRALKAERCDLWICPGHERYAFAADIPTLATAHDLMHRYEPSFPEVSTHGEYAAREFLFSELCRWSQGILVDSSVGRQQLVDSYNASPEKIFVLPYVPAAHIYDSDPSEGAEIERRYSLPPKFFFYPAQFYAHKNHPALVAAIARMRDVHPDVRLLLAGTERNGYAGAQRMVEELRVTEQVRFLGYVPDRDVAGLYRLARALVMPTFFGPTNIPPLEAFATGCPVATSRIYGIPEQVGDAALLFDPSSVDEIYDCMRRLWVDDDLCRELSTKGREHARQWGPPQFRQRLKEIIEELTRQAPVSHAGLHWPVGV